MSENQSDDVESEEGKSEHEERNENETFEARNPRQSDKDKSEEQSKIKGAVDMDRSITDGRFQCEEKYDRREKRVQVSNGNKIKSKEYNKTHNNVAILQVNEKEIIEDTKKIRHVPDQSQHNGELHKSKKLYDNKINVDKIVTKVEDNLRQADKNSMNVETTVRKCEISFRKTFDNAKTSSDHGRNEIANSDEPQYKYSFRSTVSQITATLILNFLNFNYGMVVTMPTLLVGTLDSVTALNETRLTSPQLILNETQASWLGSVLMLFHPVGAILSGHLQELLGRKTILFSINIPFLLCWALLGAAQHVGALYLASIVMGVSLGVCEAPVASYIGEISEPKLRGTISLLTGFACSVGGLVVYVLYTYTSWRTTFLLSGVIPSISLCVIGFLPESPVYLVSKGRAADAKKSLMWLRGWIRKDADNVQSETMQNIDSELEQLVSITHESNVLYINTKVRQGYNMDQVQSVEELSDHNDTIIGEAFEEKLPANGVTHTRRKSIRFDTAVKDRNDIQAVPLRRQYDRNGIQYSENNKRNMQEEREFSLGIGVNYRNKSAPNVKDTHEPSEELAYTIVKVKHPKTVLNLIRYTVRNEEIYRPLRMVLTIVAITTIASLTPIRPFLMEIIQMYDDKINTDDVLIATSVLNILGFFLCAVTINRLGKRRLSILALAVNAVVSFTLGYFAYTRVSESRIPIYCIYMNSFLQGYGILQLPWILMSEVFPLEVRGIACGVCAGSAFLLQFFFTKAYLSMTGVIGLACTICMYASTGVLGIVYIYFRMPETENRTLHQIQQHFLRK